MGRAAHQVQDLVIFGAGRARDPDQRLCTSQSNQGACSLLSCGCEPSYSNNVPDPERQSCESGLTCNEDTGAQKGGFLRDAAEQGIALVFPDTSPRGAGIANEDDDWVCQLVLRLAETDLGVS